MTEYFAAFQKSIESIAASNRYSQRCNVHAFVPIPSHKTVPMDLMECTGIIGDLDLIQSAVNNPAPGNNSP